MYCGMWGLRANIYAVSTPLSLKNVTASAHVSHLGSTYLTLCGLWDCKIRVRRDARGDGWHVSSLAYDWLLNWKPIFQTRMEMHPEFCLRHFQFSFAPSITDRSLSISWIFCKPGASYLNNWKSDFDTHPVPESSGCWNIISSDDIHPTLGEAGKSIVNGETKSSTALSLCYFLFRTYQWCWMSMDPVVREPSWFLSSCSAWKKMHGLIPLQIIQKLYGYRGSLQPSSLIWLVA